MNTFESINSPFYMDSCINFVVCCFAALPCLFLLFIIHLISTEERVRREVVEEKERREADWREREVRAFEMLARQGDKVERGKDL